MMKLTVLLLLPHADPRQGDILVSNLKKICSNINTASCSIVVSGHSCCKQSTTVISLTVLSTVNGVRRPELVVHNRRLLTSFFS